jgi:hypothetical protein
LRGTAQGPCKGAGAPFLAAEKGGHIPGIELVRRYLADLDPQLVSLDVTLSDHGTHETVKGPDEVAQYLYAILDAAFSAASIDVVSASEGDDVVAIEAVLRGDRSGPLFSHAPAGTSVVVPFVIVFATNGPVISQIRIYYDRTDLSRSCGTQPSVE